MMDADNYCGGCAKDEAECICKSGAPMSPLEAYRAEMVRYREHMAKAAQGFLELGAYKEAADCAMRAETMGFVIGRIPRGSV